jgi:hypothetical protein
MPSIDRRETLRAWGGRYVRLVLERCRGNKREACRVLDISYHTLQAYCGSNRRWKRSTPSRAGNPTVRFGRDARTEDRLRDDLEA